jgi:MFS family permease
VLLSAWFMGQFDFFVVNVAAPSLERSLRSGPTMLELVVGGYAFAYASGMITGGRLGDLFGHRRMFIIGVAAFAAASLLCGLAGTSAELIGARLAQGLAGSIMVPQVLGTITSEFDPRDRPRAVAWYGVAGGVAAIAAQVLGGWLLAADVLGLGWRVIFLINVPIGVLAAAASLRLLPRPRVVHHARLDLPGAAGVAVSLALLLVPLTLGRTEGWPPWTWVSIGCAFGVAALTGWWMRALRRRGGSPVMDTALFRMPAFAAGAAANVAFMAYFASFMFVLTLLLQSGFGLSPFQAGLAFAPMGCAFSATSLLGRVLVARYGRGIIPLGSAITAAGLIIFTTRPALPLVIVAATVMGTGNGLVLPQLIGIVLARIPAGQSGMAAGMLTTAQQFAASAGVTIIGTAFFAALGSSGYRGAAGLTAFVLIGLVALVAALVGLIALRDRGETRAGLPPPSRTGARRDL